MDRIPLDLIPQDYRRGRRYNPRACMLERGLERTRGGKWSVGADVRQRGVWWPRVWSLEEDAEQTMDQFDHGVPLSEIFHGRSTVRVHLRGKPLPAPRAASRDRAARTPRASRPREFVSRHKAATASVAVIGSMALIGDGLEWIVITAFSVALAALAAVAGIGIRRKIGARRAGYAAQAAVPEPAAWRPGWPERAAAPAPVPVPWPAEPERVRQPEPPPWPERAPAPVQRVTEPGPPRGSAPDEIAEIPAADDQAPQPAWPNVPGYDPFWTQEDGRVRAGARSPAP